MRITFYCDTPSGYPQGLKAQGMVISARFCGTAPDNDRRDKFRRALTRRSLQYYAVLRKTVRSLKMLLRHSVVTRAPHRPSLTAFTVAYLPPGLDTIGHQGFRPKGDADFRDVAGWEKSA